MESLLQDLAQQTRNDLANPEVQQKLGCELEVILNSLWHDSRLEHSPRQGVSHTPAAHPEEQDWRTIEMDALLQEFEEPEPYMDDPTLEQLQAIVEKHALGMAQVMAPYHQQMHQIAWTMISATNTLGEPFVWSSEQPLHWEVIRTLYYITQGFYLIEDRGPIPWLDQSPQYSDAVDLSFLQTRALALSHSLRPSAQARNQFHPGELTQTPQRIMELKSFGEKKYPKQTNDAALTTAWHVSALMEYADRFLPGMEKLKWNLTTCRGLLQDKKQRESILQGFAAAQLNHNTSCQCLCNTVIYDLIQYRRILTSVQILTDTVKDYDCRVDRITNNGKHTSDECVTNRNLGNSIYQKHDRTVMKQGKNSTACENDILESEPDIKQHTNRCDNNGYDRIRLHLI